MTPEEQELLYRATELIRILPSYVSHNLMVDPQVILDIMDIDKPFEEDKYAV